jgi:hypothetical protein
MLCEIVQDPCTSKPCLNGGKCVRTSSLTFTCTCPATYIGIYCEVPKGKSTQRVCKVFYSVTINCIAHNRKHTKTL